MTGGAWMAYTDVQVVGTYDRSERREQHMAIAILGIALVALLAGAVLTLLVITTIGADRKLRRARREAGKKEDNP